MRVKVCSVLAAGKICTALLGVVPIALIAPARDMAFSQTGTGTVAQAPLFTAIDLTPSGSTSSFARGISGGRIVGGGDKGAWLWNGSPDMVDLLYPGGAAEAISGGEEVGWAQIGDRWHALLWHGSAESMVDLNPGGFSDAKALGTSGGEQVGTGLQINRDWHALLWRGSAASAVDLHPSGFEFSQASAVSGGQQVGWGAPTQNTEHALLWRGSATSVVDLNPPGYDYSAAAGTSGEQQVGWGDGRATGGLTHALLWRGSAASVVDLNPAGFDISQAHATSGGQQVGWGYSQATGRHALLWRGSAARAVDLHVFLPAAFVTSTATGIDSNGDIVGYAGMSYTDSYPSHAFLWKRNVSAKPGSRLTLDPKELKVSGTTPVELILTFRSQSTARPCSNESTTPVPPPRG